MFDKKGKLLLPFLLKDVGTSFNVRSGKRGSHSRPQPWQGCALPTELFPHLEDLNYTSINHLKRPYRTTRINFSKISQCQRWRRGPESNRPTRICNPVHNRFATAPCFKTDWLQKTNKKGKLLLPFLLKDVGTSFNVWSGKRGSNSRPQPWQGCALPTELFPHFRELGILCRVRCDG